MALLKVKLRFNEKLHDFNLSKDRQGKEYKKMI